MGAPPNAKQRAARRAPVLAKLARPRPDRPYPRARLFKLLDGARKKPLIWLAAPAGSGKTTLVTSYLDARKLKHLWYQLDARDADAASFFYFLRLAVQKISPRKVETLPLLTPEYYLDLSAFARSFFEKVALRIKTPAVVVLDNYQDVPEGLLLHALLAESIAVLPKGISLLVLSRAAPPPAYARLRAHGEIAMLGWEEIKFTRTELSALVRRHLTRKVPAAGLDRLYARTHGWAAGVMLLLEAGRDTSSDPLESTEQETLFNYFATEIFQRAETDIQEFLAKSALLPQMTAAGAEALTGNPRAARILADLARRQFFTMRHAGDGAVYQYHPLFREYLLHEGCARFTPESWNAMKRRAASILADAGAYEDAVGLMRESADTQGLVGLIHRYAPELAGHGRFATLEQWLHALPAGEIENLPWLAYWSGMCRLPFDPLAARAHFERGYRQFRAAGDAAGAYLCWAGIADSFIFMWDDFTDLRSWLAEFDALQRDQPEFPSLETEARVTASVFGAMAYMQVRHPHFDRWRRRANTLMYSSLDPNYRIQLAANLGSYYVLMGRIDDSRRVARLVHALVRERSATPFSRIIASGCQTLSLLAGGDPESAERISREAIEISARSGAHILDMYTMSQIVYARGMTGDLAGMGEYLDRIRERLLPARRLDVAHYHSLLGWYEGLRGDYPRAVAYAREARELTRCLSCEFPIVLVDIDLAQVLALSGALDEADSLIGEAAEQAQDMRSHYLSSACGIVRAYTALRRGRHAVAADTLRTALGPAAQSGYWYVGAQPALMRTVCLFALQQGIEPGYIRRLIRSRGMTPDSPPAELECWPWRVKVYALGRFTVLLDDKPLVFSGKGQKKALELLKALVALGGRGVPERRLAEALWPESEAARANFKSTLHRLRRLIGAETLALSEGRLSLDRHTVWVDALAFEGALDAAGADPARLLAALPLYKGAFMAGEEESYVLVPRERFKSRFQRAALKAGANLEHEGRCEEAVELYESALAVDELAEPLYQGLMRCYGRLNRPAEALAVYARCARTLSAAFGVDPNAETEALRNTLVVRRSGS